MALAHRHDPSTCWPNSPTSFWLHTHLDHLYAVLLWGEAGQYAADEFARLNQRHFVGNSLARDATGTAWSRGYDLTVSLL
jgi:hypothetical protein